MRLTFFYLTIFISSYLDIPRYDENVDILLNKNASYENRQIYQKPHNPVNDLQTPELVIDENYEKGDDCPTYDIHHQDYHNSSDEYPDSDFDQCTINTTSNHACLSTATNIEFHEVPEIAPLKRKFSIQSIIYGTAFLTLKFFNTNIFNTKFL